MKHPFMVALIYVFKVKRCGMPTSKFKKVIKTWVRNRLFQLGYEVGRRTVRNSDRLRLSRILETHDVSLVLDVGANTGQYAHTLREIGYKGRIVSFEPLSDAHRMLSSMASGDSRWIVPAPMALGRKSGESIINISRNSVSSSLSRVLPRHVQSQPNSVVIGHESVQVVRLDHVATSFINENDVVYLKLDVQGYEKQVLDGAGSMLKNIKGIQMELSLVPLYEDQLLFEEMLKFMRDEGFELIALEPGFSDPESGRMWQVDGIFFRPDVN